MIKKEGRIAFDRYAVDLETRELISGGRSVYLQDKPFRLLLTFLKSPGRVIPRAELYAALWPADLHVDREAGLNTAIRKLRRALSELPGGDRKLLATVPRVGYRLCVGAAMEPPTPAARLGATATRVAWTPVHPLVVALGLALVTVLVATGLARFGRAPGDTAEAMPRGAEPRARYVEARTLLSTMGGDLSRARELLRSVIRELPEFAPAHAYLAEASARRAMRTATPADLDNARHAARRARELDPGSAVAHRVQAMIALNFDWDVGAAGVLMNRALRLDPEDPINHLTYATYASTLGRHEEAIAAVRHAVDLQPDSMAIRSDAGYFLLRAGRPREAARECNLVLRLEPASVYARDCLLTAFSTSGDFDAARPHALHLLRLAEAPDAVIEEASSADDPRRVYLTWTLERLLDRPDPPAVRVATCYLSLGDRSHALAWLERAAREREPQLAFIPQNSDFSQLRDDPRYRKILRSSGLDVFTADAGRSEKPATANGLALG